MARDRVVLMPYDPAWAVRFDAERNLLAATLGGWLEGGIHHIGSTAIPGIAAKPVIDMLAGVRDLGAARAAFDPLYELGYISTPHRQDEAHHFSKPSSRLPEAAYGLHLTEPGSDLWRERLAFRDALRGDTALAAEYDALRARVVELHGSDLAAYTTGKRGFVARVLAGARLELRSL